MMWTENRPRELWPEGKFRRRAASSKKQTSVIRAGPRQIPTGLERASVARETRSQSHFPHAEHRLRDGTLVQTMEEYVGSTTDKTKGYANQAVGKAKEKIGQATGSGQTETQGNVQSMKGNAQVAAGKAKETIKKAID